jgi:uracil-DNA glycosylase family 4
MTDRNNSLYHLLRDYLEQEAASGEFNRLSISKLPPLPGTPVTPATPVYSAVQNTPDTILEQPQEEYGLESTKTPQEFTLPDGDKASQIKALVAYIGDCQKCAVLARERQKIVFGSGNPNADIMFVGEAPGRDEDIQGLPFVGRAGQLLMNIIEKGMSLSREDVYIANILKCRPPNNRNPQSDEVANCTPFLHWQLDIVRPRVIIALGLFATQFLTGKNEGIGKLRGQFHYYRDIPVMPTYHPAYLLRNYNRDSRQKVWDDVQMVMQFLKDNPSA